MSRQRQQVILPGSAIGVLGSGQLGRMFAIAARQMGYLVHTFCGTESRTTLSPDRETPTGQVSDVELVHSYDDLDAVRTFAKNVAVVTFEFENVPAATAAAAAEHAWVRPAGEILHTTQNRIREKTFLRDAGFPVTPFEPVHDAEQLRQAAARLGTPGVLKTSAWGYDGKGQIRIDPGADLTSAWNALGTDAAVYESFITFEKELSVIVSRGMSGEMIDYGPVHNTHVNHILDVTIAPALGIDQRVAEDAVEIARGTAEKIGLVGVLCVELFLDERGNLMINELAPRPHNSGHFTIDACVTSQFEQQVRAVCGLPLGSPRQHAPAAMVNLLGDLWKDGEPDWAAACAHPAAKLHLYGKAQPRPGRKMGHITVLAETGEEAARIALAARTVAASQHAPAP